MGLALKKRTAFYNPKTKPTPLDEHVDGMWITKEDPHVVVRIWATESERPLLREEPPYIQAYSAYMARQWYDFRPMWEKDTDKKKR